MTRPLVLTAAEAAAVLRCSASHIRALAARGELERVPHVGRRVLIPTRAVEERLGERVEWLE